MIIEDLEFRPFPGLSSRHLQTIIPSYWPPGEPPSSREWRVDLGAGDRLSCMISDPKDGGFDCPTVILLHGLGGSHASSYMIRVGRKLCEAGYRVVRVNLRNCGSGKNLSHLPYNAGNSKDILALLESLKHNYPSSSLTLVGFSLGGNIALKLAGEIGDSKKNLLDKVLAICPPLDLAKTVQMIQKKSNYLYHRYFLKKLLVQAQPWIHQPLKTLYEFDNVITASCWGYKDAEDYYAQCSSLYFISTIKLPTRILVSGDDPFVDPHPLKMLTLPESVRVTCTKYGGHMGYIGSTQSVHDLFWLDALIMKWIS